MVIKSKLLFLSCLLLSASTIYPLTSCGSDGSSNDIGGFDKEFDFDAQVYNRLENEFINKYRNQLLNDDNIDKNIALNKYDNFLQNDITTIRNQLFDPAQNYSFTIRTNTLMDYASKNYNIYLNRNSDVSETDFSNLKKSSLENFIICLDNVYGIDNTKNKQEKIDNFSTKFDLLLNECSTKYTDNAQVLMYLRAGIINCWEDFNQQFASISAYNHLKDFFDDYEFVVKDQSDRLTNNNKLLWDNLLVNEQFITNDKTGLIDQDLDCPISDQWINDLFAIFKRKNHTENNSFDSQDDSTSDILTGYSEIHDFNSQEIIPGYTLIPVLKTMSQDIYANNYYMNIDWQLISNKYKNETNQNIKDNVTAHIAYNKDGQIVKNDDFKNGQLSSKNYQFTKYSLFATPTYQKDILINAYFDNEKDKHQKITFSWDEQKIGIEYFLPSDAYNGDDFVAPDDSYNQTITQDNLSEIGLQLNGTNLSDLLDKQNKSQDNQAANKLINPDDNLKIEEKFVKYCTINAISTIVFANNNVSNNKIQNTFISSYNNTDDKCEIHNIQEETDLNNIGASSIFNDTAVTFYNNVADYINSQEIEDKFITSDKTSDVVRIELLIVGAIILVWLILLIYQASKGFFKDYDVLNDLGANSVQKMRTITHPIILLIVFFSFTLIITFIWSKFVYKPLHENLAGIKNWNHNFANGLANKINVVKKVNNDKKYFNSSTNFDKYFQTNGSEAFASYFYYLHFNNLLSITDENLVSIIDEVKNDYKQFNETKEKFIKTGPIYESKNIICACIFVVGIIVMLILLKLQLNDIQFIKDKLQAVSKLNHYIDLIYEIERNNT